MRVSFFVDFELHAGRDSKGRPDRREGKNSPVDCFRPWESPSGSKTRPAGVWIAANPIWKR